MYYNLLILQITLLYLERIFRKIFIFDIINEQKLYILDFMLIQMLNSKVQ